MITNRFRSYLQLRIPKNKLPAWINAVEFKPGSFLFTFKYDLQIIPYSLRTYYLGHGKQGGINLNNQELETWCIWVKRNIVTNESMINTDYITDAVKIRIATGMLNKLTIPESHKQLIHTRLLECYYIRKQACLSYKITHVLKVPF